MIKNIYKYLIIVGVLSVLSANYAFSQHYTNPDKSPTEGQFNLDHILLFADNIEESRLKLFANVVYDDVTFLKKDDKFSADYRATFSILDENNKYIDSRRINNTIVTDDYFNTNSREKFDLLEAEFTLTSGKYTVIFELLDKETRSTKKQTINVSVPSIKGADILLSGPILLDTAIVLADGNIELQPGVSGNVFDGRQSIWVYFEVYSRIFPEDINIEYHLLDNKGEERITGNFTRSIESPVLRERFILDIKEFSFGNYQLVLKASNSASSTQNLRKFRIHWPELPQTIIDIDEAIDQLQFIATEREITKLKEYYKDRRLEMFVKFWAKWADGDEVEGYKLMEEYYYRVWEANQLFNEGGWKCDRGHVYLIHGSPSEIDRHPSDMYRQPYEVWYYHDDNKRFVFVDEGGFGDFKLRSPFWGN